MDLSVAMSDCFFKVEKDDKKNHWHPAASTSPWLPGPLVLRASPLKSPSAIDLPGAALLAYQAEPMRFDQAWSCPCVFFLVLKPGWNPAFLGKGVWDGLFFKKRIWENEDDFVEFFLAAMVSAAYITQERECLPIHRGVPHQQAVSMVSSAPIVAEVVIYYSTSSELKVGNAKFEWDSLPAISSRIPLSTVLSRCARPS